QHQEKVWLRFADAIRVKNWDMSSGQKVALLVGVSVNCVIDKVCPNAAVVEKRIALGRSPVAGYRLAFLLRLNEEFQQTTFRLLDFFRKRDVGVKPVNPKQCFLLDKLIDGRHHLFRRIPSVTCVNPQRASMRGQLVDIKNFQALLSKNPFDGHKGKIGEMLM